MDTRDSGPPKTVKIGKVTVGLDGLDMTIGQAIAKQLSPEEAGEFLFKAVSTRNYIPPGKEDDYKEALRILYERQVGLSSEAEKGLVIRVLGRPCVSCNKMGEMSIEVLQKLGIAADVENVHELDEIWRYGITTTPALIINGKVKCAGRLPTIIEVENWIKEEIG